MELSVNTKSTLLGSSCSATVTQTQQLIQYVQVEWKQMLHQLEKNDLKTTENAFI